MTGTTNSFEPFAEARAKRPLVNGEINGDGGGDIGKRLIALLPVRSACCR